MRDPNPASSIGAKPIHEREADVRESDRAAFEHLYRHHYTRLRTCAKLLGRTLDADDLVHDVFTRVWAHRYDRQLGAIDGAYLQTALRNHSRNAHARDCVAARWRDRYACTDDAQVAPDPFGPREAALVRAALDALTPGEREAVRLVLEEGKTQREAALVLAVSVKAVEHRMGRATAVLRRIGRTAVACRDDPAEQPAGNTPVHRGGKDSG